MEAKIESQRLIKPLYDEENSSICQNFIPLNVFDVVNYDIQVAVIYCYRPPTPPNATLELGLRKTLSVFRSLAGRRGKDANSEPIVLLNDEGVRFVEASVDTTFDQAIPSLEPSPSFQNFHQNLDDASELAQVQLTRFTCGSLLIGITTHHLVGDGPSMCKFMLAWCQACRGLDINTIPCPVLDRTIFNPRSPPRIEFEHEGVEFMRKNQRKDYSHEYHNDIVVTNVRFTRDFVNKLKIETSANNERTTNYTTFESLMAHIWRTVTKARGLSEHEMTHVRISVDGRTRMINHPSVSNYFGNLILWAFPTSNVKDLLNQPLAYAAKLIRDAVTKVNDRYFESFIDFANTRVKAEDLIPTADANKHILCPNMNVDSWIKYPLGDIDFGCGSPFFFTPTYHPIEGLISLLPSSVGDGSIDAYIGMFKDHVANFQQICLLEY